MHSVLVAQIPEYAAITSPYESAAAAIDEATAATLHRVKVAAMKRSEAVVWAALAATAKRTFLSSGPESLGYAHALQASLMVAIRECAATMVAVWAAEQRAGSVRSPSVHTFNSPNACAVAATEEATASMLQRV
jgi:hypothetical protein